MSNTIGWIGLGRMGEAMVKRLVQDEIERRVNAQVALNSCVATTVEELEQAKVPMQQAVNAGHKYVYNDLQDALARLDVTIDSLLTRLDRQVGAGRYTVVLTADHGVAPIPETALTHGLHAGRYTSTLVKNAVEAALDRAIDADATWIANVTAPFVYFTPGSAERIRRSGAGRPAGPNARR